MSCTTTLTAALPTRWIGMAIAIAVTMGIAAAATAQTTTNYIGPNNGLWSNPANWDIGQVPINGKDGTFNVIISGNRTVHFDMEGTNEISGLSLAGDGSRINVWDGVSLHAIGVGVIGGVISAVGEDRSFVADSQFTIFSGTRPQLFASEGGHIHVDAVQYVFNQNWDHSTIISSAGDGSIIDLSALGSLSVTGSFGSGERLYTVRAIDGGLLDLSGVTSITGVTSGNNWLRVLVNDGGEIDLTSLTTAAGRLRWDIQEPSFGLPSLQSVTGTSQWNVQVPYVAFPSLQSVSGNSSFVLSAGTTLDMPAVISLSGSIFSDWDDGTVIAPLLSTFTGGFIGLNPSRTFIAPSFTSINNSRFHIGGGASFDVAASSYAWNQGWDSTTIMSASGNDTLLDLSTIETLSVTGVQGSGERVYTIQSVNGGQLDLSGVTSMTGVTSGNNWLRLLINSGGSLDLGLLQAVSGRTIVEVKVPLYELPSLQSASSTRFEVSIFNKLHLPVAQSMNNCTLAIDDGGTIEAPALTTFTNGFIGLNPSRFLIAPAFTSINNSRFHVAGGASFDVAASSYVWNQGWDSTTIMSASGNGTLLDLSTIGTVSVTGVQGGGERLYTFQSVDGGRLDLSGATSITGVTSGNNWLRILINDGGTTLFGSATFNSSRTRIELDGTASRMESVCSVDLRNPVRITASNVSTLAIAGDLTFNHSDATAVHLSNGILHMNGSEQDYLTAQRLEVAGADLGLPGGSIPLNFQIGQLIIGDHDQSTHVRLVDNVNNGNRGPNGEPEVLYVQGFPAEDGLRIRGGSTLILDGVEMYAVINNEWTHINSLFSKGANLIEYDDGFIGLIKVGDLNGDGVVNVSDLLILLANWGLCPEGNDCPADLNDDGVVNVSDLLMLLANWG
jgi:hypothetical protein